MKVDRYYDVQCDHCGKSLSTDYHLGFFTSRDTAIKVAKRIGFKTDKQRLEIIQEYNDKIKYYEQKRKKC